MPGTRHSGPGSTKTLAGFPGGVQPLHEGEAMTERLTGWETTRLSKHFILLDFLADREVYRRGRPLDRTHAARASKSPHGAFHYTPRAESG